MRRKDTKGRSRPVLLGLAVVLALGMLVLTGCGSSGGSSSGGTTAEGKGPSGATFEISADDRKCLKEKGVELPQPGSGPQTFGKGEAPEGAEPPEAGAMPEGGPPTSATGGAMNEEAKQAFEECGVEMPEFKGGPGGTGGPNVNSAAFKKQVKEYAACVRENGFKLAEPNFSGEGPIFEKSESESAAFKKASAKCSDLLGGPQGGEAGGSEES